MYVLRKPNSRSALEHTRSNTLARTHSLEHRYEWKIQQVARLNKFTGNDPSEGHINTIRHLNEKFEELGEEEPTGGNPFRMYQTRMAADISVLGTFEFQLVSLV